MSCLYNKSSTHCHVGLRQKCMGVRSVMDDTVYDEQLYRAPGVAETGQLLGLEQLTTQTNVMKEELKWRTCKD